MSIELLPITEQQELAVALDRAIRDACNRRVDRRSSLKLARALLAEQPAEADTFYAQRLIEALKARIDRKVELAARIL